MVAADLAAVWKGGNRGGPRDPGRPGRCGTTDWVRFVRGMRRCQAVCGIVRGLHNFAGPDGRARRRVDGIRCFADGFFGRGEKGLALEFQEGQGGFQEDHGVGLAEPEVSFGLAVLS